MDIELPWARAHVSRRSEGSVGLPASNLRTPGNRNSTVSTKRKRRINFVEGGKGKNIDGVSPVTQQDVDGGGWHLVDSASPGRTTTTAYLWRAYSRTIDAAVFHG